MDKFSGLKAATCIAAKNFERWSKLAALTSESSSVLHSTTLLETSQLLSDLLAELEAKDERIGELEAIATDYAGKFQKAQDALKYAAIMSDEDKKKISELEAKLATPVRLPNKSDDEFWFDGVFQVAKFDRAVERALSSAGFKFVGEE